MWPLVYTWCSVPAVRTRRRPGRPRRAARRPPRRAPPRASARRRLPSAASAAGRTGRDSTARGAPVSMSAWSASRVRSSVRRGSHRAPVRSPYRPDARPASGIPGIPDSWSSTRAEDGCGLPRTRSRGHTLERVPSSPVMSWGPPDHVPGTPPCSAGTCRRDDCTWARVDLPGTGGIGGHEPRCAGGLRPLRRAAEADCYRGNCPQAADVPSPGSSVREMREAPGL